MTRAEVVEKVEGDGRGVPKTYLPNVTGRVRMSARLCCGCCEHVCEVPERRRGDWGRLYANAVGGGCAGHRIDVVFKEAVVPAAPEGVKRVGAGYDGQEISNIGGLEVKGLVKLFHLLL